MARIKRDRGVQVPQVAIDAMRVAADACADAGDELREELLRAMSFGFAVERKPAGKWVVLPHKFKTEDLSGLVKRTVDEAFETWIAEDGRFAIGAGITVRTTRRSKGFRVIANYDTYYQSGLQLRKASVSLVEVCETHVAPALRQVFPEAERISVAKSSPESSQVGVTITLLLPRETEMQAFASQT